MKVVYLRISAFLQSQLTRLRGFSWSGNVLLVMTLIALFFGYCFIKLADEVMDGETQTVDERILRSLRRVDDPAVPIGPAWLLEAGLNVTALGSHAVLALMVVAVVGLMWFQQRYGAVMLTVLAVTTGYFVMVCLKHFIERDRPTVVPLLQKATSHSFPSGHAMLSAIVYLTLGILLMEIVHGRAAKLYCLAWAMSLTFLVGISRIYLGVHYPTDVLAGWMAGTAWALACRVVVQYASHRLTFFEKRIKEVTGRNE
jgi:undecaprenyl-diphosphatase